MTSHESSYPNNRERDSSSRRQKKYEETALVLDIIEGEVNTRNDKYKGQTIVQAIGTNYFSLLEIIPTDEIQSVRLMDEIVLGKEERAVVETIIGRISVNKLSNVAESSLEESIEKILDLKRERFVSWLNNAPAISIRLHSYQVINGIGPKGMKAALEARKQKEFASFEDFEERSGISNIKGLLKQRIFEELTDEEEKYHLFTRPAPKEHEKKQSSYQRTRSTRRRIRYKYD